MEKNGIVSDFFKTVIELPSVWKRQDKNWRTTVTRTSLERLGYKVIYPYLSVFIIALGATKAQLGWLTGAGLLFSGLIGPWTGRFIDRSGTKKVYIIGILGLLCCYLTYFLSHDWRMCIVAMMLYYFGSDTAIHGCETICANCLDNCDRAKGMLICESMASGLLGMIGPLIASFLLVNVIGADKSDPTADDIRWLFLVSALCTAISLLVIVKRLQNRKWSMNEEKGSWRDGIQVLKDNKNARKWLLVGAVNYLPYAMVLPYFQVVAKEFKGAGVTTLAVMVTASAIISILFGYPIGIIADKFGRKKILYILLPLFWLSIVLLMFGNGAAWLLILAGALLGFYDISGPITAAFMHELIAPEVMGTWLGVTRLTNAVVAAVMAVVSGSIYDKIGPKYMFLIFLAADILIRLPLIISIPETLHNNRKVEK